MMILKHIKKNYSRDFLHSGQKTRNIEQRINTTPNNSRLVDEAYKRGYRYDSNKRAWLSPERADGSRVWTRGFKAGNLQFNSDGTITDLNKIKR